MQGPLCFLLEEKFPLCLEMQRIVANLKGLNEQFSGSRVKSLGFKISCLFYNWIFVVYEVKKRANYTSSICHKQISM